MKNEKVMERALHNLCLYDSLVLLRNIREYEGGKYIYFKGNCKT